VPDTQTTAAPDDERWREHPSLTDLYLTLLAAPGFNDNHVVPTRLIDDMCGAWALRMTRPSSTLGEPSSTFSRVVHAPAHAVGNAGRVAMASASAVAAGVRHAWRQTPLGRPEDKSVQGINFMVWGPPGDGKSQGVSAAMRLLGYDPWKKDLSRTAPQDLTGIPARVNRWSLRGRTVFTAKAPDLFFWNLARSGQGKNPNVGLQLEDLTNTVKTVQGAGLGIVLDKEIDDGKGGYLSIRQAPIAATANFSEVSTVTQLLGPMANRFVHIFTSPDEDATTWWMTGQAPVHVDIDRAKAMRSEWAERYGSARALCSGFVRDYRSRAWDAEPTDFDNTKNYAWTTPRSLELAARCIAAADHMGISDERLLKGALGEQGARRLMDYRRNLKLPTVEDVYAKRVLWKVLSPSGQVVLLQRAATQCRDSEQLSAVLRGMDAVRDLTSGSDDLVVLAVDALRDRASGQMASRPMSDAMAAQVASALPRSRALTLTTVVPEPVAPEPAAPQPVAPAPVVPIAAAAAAAAATAPPNIPSSTSPTRPIPIRPANWGVLGSLIREAMEGANRRRDTGNPPSAREL